MPDKNKCVGCQWRMPIELGGQGILCHEHDGRCPVWVGKWTSHWGGVRGYTRFQKEDDEGLAEANRL